MFQTRLIPLKTCCLSSSTDTLQARDDLGIKMENDVIKMKIVEDEFKIPDETNIEDMNKLLFVLECYLLK